MFNPVGCVKRTIFSNCLASTPAFISSSIALAATISAFFSTAGTVSETRIVSPIPSANSGTSAALVFAIPSGGIPASVTPRCSGTSGRRAAKRRFTSSTRDGAESFSDTQ